MTKPRPSQADHQILFPLDDQDPEGTDSTQRQVLRAKLRRTLAAGDMAGASLLLQLAMLQTLERIEDRLAEIADRLEQREV